MGEETACGGFLCWSSMFDKTFLYRKNAGFLPLDKWERHHQIKVVWWCSYFLFIGPQKRVSSPIVLHQGFLINTHYRHFHTPKIFDI